MNHLTKWEPPKNVFFLQLHKVCSHENTFLGSGGGGATFVFSIGVDSANGQLNDSRTESLLSKLVEDNLLLVASGGGGSGSSRSSAKSDGENGLTFDQDNGEESFGDKNAKINWKNNTLKLLLSETNASDFSNCKGQSQRLGGFPGGIRGCKHGQYGLTK